MNLKVELLKGELDINSEERKCEDCWDRLLWAVNAAYEASSCSEIDLGFGTVCELTENAENGLFVINGFTVSPVRVSFICFL